MAETQDNVDLTANNVVSVREARPSRSLMNCILQLVSLISLFAIAFLVLTAVQLKIAPWDVHWLGNAELNSNIVNIAIVLKVELILLFLVTIGFSALVVRNYLKADSTGSSDDREGNSHSSTSLSGGHSATCTGATVTNALEDGDDTQPTNRSNSQAKYDQANAEAQLTIATDELDRVRKELSICREKLEQATIAKGEFLANMSHELLTPMNGIQGMTDLLLAADLPAKEKRFVNSIAGSSNSLLSIINDLLDYSKIESGSLKLENARFSVRDCVEDVCSSLASQAHAKEVELISYVDENVPEQMEGDPSRVRQILKNMVSNAIAFTEDGEVVVRLVRDEDTKGKALYKCDVQDTGSGISPEIQAQLFSIFTQADSSITRTHGGLGMGLAIANELISLMGGEMSFRSRLGEGSRFSFSVQLNDVPDAEAVSSRRRTLSGAHVLIVDDNDTNRTILYHQLASWGLVVDTAESGEAALITLKDSHDKGHSFDAIVLDLRMPGMNGLEFAERVQQSDELSNIKMLLLSSAELELSGEQLQELGIYKFVSKPVRQSILHDSLVSIMPSSNANTADLLLKTPKPKNARVLLVEDNLVNQDVATGMLEQLGCDVTIAKDGDVAVKLGESEKYDMVLMDCQMPMMDGYEATRRIKNDGSLNAPTPIVALTANSSNDDREKCLSAGMDDYVSKPIRTQMLSHMIDKWVAHPINKLDPDVMESDPPMLFTGDRDSDLQTTDVPGKISVKPAPAITADQLEDAASATRDSEMAKEATVSEPVDTDESKDVNVCVNQAAIDSIRAMQKPGKDDILSKVVKGYFARSNDIIEQITTASDKGDTGAVGEGAKSLKSSSAYLGAEALSALCEQIELAATANQTAEIASLADALKEEYEKVSVELNTLLKAA